jgi:small subunit ribosomal protein S6
MVRDYELMYIVRPELDDEGLQAAVASVEQIVSAAGGSVVHTTNWGRRRLAYEVDHLRDGHYMLLHVRMDGARVVDLERALTIHETVFRHLLVLREGEAEAEAEPDGAAPDGAGEAARQTVVAALDDDGAEDEDEDDDVADVPAAVLIADEEET